MRQTWGSLLFMHWPIDPAALRPLIPEPIEINRFAGAAWIGVIPQTMWNVRAVGCPPPPGLSAFHELNVRTYVRLGGAPGVWFFSLDANKRIPVHVARRTFHLNYLYARMSLRREAGRIHYTSRRVHRGAPPAEFETAWRPGEPMARSQPGSLEYFLTERYRLFTARGEWLYQARIAHRPWPLRRAALDHWRSTMIEALGIEEPRDEPLLHFADQMDVEVWPLRPASRLGDHRSEQS